MMDIQLPRPSGYTMQVRGDAPSANFDDHKIVCVGNLGIFVVLGWDAQTHHFRNVWKLNFATRIWKRLIDTVQHDPFCINSLSFLDENRLLMFGGRAWLPRSAADINQVHLYHIESYPNMEIDPWKKIVCVHGKPPNMESEPQGFKLSTFDKHNGFLYVVSPTVMNDRGSLKIYCLNIASWTWEKLSDGPTWNEHNFYAGGIFICDELLYLPGFSKVSEHSSVIQIATFSVISHSWRFLDVSSDIETFDCVLVQ